METLFAFCKELDALSFPETRDDACASIVMLVNVLDEQVLPKALKKLRSITGLTGDRLVAQFRTMTRVVESDAVERVGVAHLRRAAEAAIREIGSGGDVGDAAAECIAAHGAVLASKRRDGHVGALLDALVKCMGRGTPSQQFGAAIAVGRFWYRAGEDLIACGYREARRSVVALTALARSDGGSLAKGAALSALANVAKMAPVGSLFSTEKGDGLTLAGAVMQTSAHAITSGTASLVRRGDLARDHKVEEWRYVGGGCECLASWLLAAVQAGEQVPDVCLAALPDTREVLTAVQESLPHLCHRRAVPHFVRSIALELAPVVQGILAAIDKQETASDRSEDEEGGGEENAYVEREEAPKRNRGKEKEEDFERRREYFEVGGGKPPQNRHVEKERPKVTYREEREEKKRKEYFEGEEDQYRKRQYFEGEEEQNHHHLKKQQQQQQYFEGEEHYNPAKLYSFEERKEEQYHHPEKYTMSPEAPPSRPFRFHAATDLRSDESVLQWAAEQSASTIGRVSSLPFPLQFAISTAKPEGLVKMGVEARDALLHAVAASILSAEEGVTTQVEVGGLLEWMAIAMNSLARDGLEVPKSERDPVLEMASKAARHSREQLAAANLPPAPLSKSLHTAFAHAAQNLAPDHAIAAATASQALERIDNRRRAVLGAWTE